MTKWLVCSRFPDYQVSEDGLVKRCNPASNHKAGTFLEPLRPKFDKGYPFLTLRKEGKTHSVKVYRLVAESFIGPKPFEGAEVCHNDGDKLNNHYSNLRWDTHKSNHQDRIVHGSSNRGAKNGKAKITAEDVVQIRRLYASGELQRDIAEIYGLKAPTISLIVNRINWDHVP